MSYNTYQAEEVHESIPMMTRQWLNNYNALSNKTTIAVQEAGSNRRKAKGILEEVEEEIPILRNELESDRRSIGDAEYRSRSRKLKQLENNVRTVKADLSGASGNSWRSDNRQENVNTFGLNNNQVLQQSDQRLLEQDKHLDDIQNSLARITNQARDHAEELDQHAVLIDDIRDNMDYVQDRTGANTERVERVTKKTKDSACCCLMAILAVAIIVLLVYTP